MEQTGRLDGCEEDPVAGDPLIEPNGAIRLAEVPCLGAPVAIDGTFGTYREHFLELLLSAFPDMLIVVQKAAPLAADPGGLRRESETVRVGR
jgi:hypothetical protein